MGSKIGNSKSQYSDLSIPDKIEPIVNYDTSISMPAEEEVVISKRQKCVDCCKKFVAFLFSTIGLTSMLVGYTILGAFIFTELEAPHEKRAKSRIQESRLWHVKELWNLTLQFNIFFEPNWTMAAESLFVNYTEQVYEAAKKDGWDGKDEDAEIQWSFAGAMLYSITVITTIGYGHIAPKTTWGRIVTIIYAIFGIPLCLLTLTNLGGFMATAFRYIYNNICCGLCCLCCEKPRSAYVTSALAQSEEAGRSGELSPSGESVGSQNGAKRSPKKKVSMQVTWRSGLRRVLKTEDNKTVTVPIYVSLLLIAGYILSGAVLFTLWEEDWNYLEGSYFVFITLSTIGFGDYVPGSSQDSWNNQEKLVLCCMYLIFGLALIAMCFDLMQEEARSKVRFLGIKLGLITPEKSNDDVKIEGSNEATQVTTAANKTPGKQKMKKEKPLKEKRKKEEKDKKTRTKEKDTNDKSKKNSSKSKSRRFRLPEPPSYKSVVAKQRQHLIGESTEASPDSSPHKAISVETDVM